MPAFRFINPPVGLEDATYLFDSNPDPERYEEVGAKPAKSTKAPAAESETEAN